MVTYVTGYGKTAHFAHYFKIEFLVFKGSVDLKQKYAVIIFVMEVTCCGVLAVSIQSLMAYCFKTKSRKRWLKYHFRHFAVLRNFDDVLRIRYLKCQLFLAEAWPSCSGV